MTTISIIIPTYNGSEMLVELLRSIEAQTYPRHLIEIIVVDDGSTDASIARLQPTSGLTVVRCTRRRGPAAAKNRGAACARGAWLLFLDNDVVLAPSFVDTMITTAQRESAGCSQGKLLFDDRRTIIASAGGAGNRYGCGWDRGVYEEDRGQYDQAPDITFASSAALLVRRDLFQNVGGFDPAFFYLYEDYDLGLRLAFRGHASRFVPAAVAYHRQSATMGRSSWAVFYLRQRNRLLVLLKYFSMRTILAGIIPLNVRTVKTCSRTQRRQPLDWIRYLTACVCALVWLLMHVKIYWRTTSDERHRNERTWHALLRCSAGTMTVVSAHEREGQRL